MLRSMISDKANWISSLLLDPVTGLDQPDAKIKVRAVEGLNAASYFIPGYCKSLCYISSTKSHALLAGVWAKVIENLSVIGYDNSDLHLASYE